MAEIIVIPQLSAPRPSTCLGHALWQRAVVLERLWQALTTAQPAIFAQRM